MLRSEPLASGRVLSETCFINIIGHRVADSLYHMMRYLKQKMTHLNVINNDK